MADEYTTTTPDDGQPVRIGDAERQRMTELLQQHMAAGRLDMAEFERRVEHATSAVYERDLDGLLDDLPVLDDDGEPWTAPAGGRRPRSHDEPAAPWWEVPSRGRGRLPWSRGVPSPLLVVGGILLVVLTHGWILLPLLFLTVARRGGCGPRHRGPGGPRERWDPWSARDDHDSTGAASGRDDGTGTPRWPGRFDPYGDDRRM